MSKCYLILVIISSMLLCSQMHGQSKKELYNLSKKALSEGDFRKSEMFLNRMLELKDSLTQRNMIAIYNRFGIINRELGHYTRALDYYKEVERIFQNGFSEDSVLLALTYCNIANIYVLLVDYERAIEYCNKALEILSKTKTADYNGYCIIYLDLGGAYLSKNEYNKALFFFDRSIELIKKNNFEGIEEVYINLAKTYEKMENYFFAKKYYLMSIDKWKSGKVKKSYKLASAYSKYGLLLSKIGQKDSSLFFFEKGIKIYLSIYGKKHPFTSNAYRRIGDFYFENDSLEKALGYYQQSLISNSITFSDKNQQSNPEISDVLSENQLYVTLKSKSNVLLSASLNSVNEEQKTDYLNACIVSIKIVFDLIHKLRNDYSYESSQLFLSEDSKLFYLTAIHAAFELSKEQPTFENQLRIFEYLEKSKSATLSTYLNDMESRGKLNIADSLIEREKEVSINRRFYNTKIQQSLAQKEGYDTTLITNYQNALFDYSRQYDTLITTLKTQYPDYYQLKYQQVVASVDDIQKQLDKNAALINYFVADTSLFIAAVTKDSLVYKIVKTDSAFNQQIIDYHIDIKSGFGQKELENSTRLYQYLIAPIEGLIENKNSLVVIPDEYLYYIPFETLCKNATHADNLSSVDFLIKDYDIGYHHSATLWLNNKVKERKSTVVENNFVGFAPVFDSKVNNGYILSNDWISDTTNVEMATRSVSTDLKHFNALPYSEKEIKSILKLFKKNGGKATGYFHKEANEESFKQQAQNYKYIHIASHSFANDKYPALSGIAFSQPDTTSSSEQKDDGILYAGESYNLNLSKADLVVLSSCKSGLGKLVKGEGFLSLSRGFLYAGVPNLVFSLWNVKDEPTKDLMVEFYKQVLSGQNYANSLRNAKLKLIANSKTAEPKNWAAWVLVGE